MASPQDIAIIFNPNSTGDAPANAHELKQYLTASLPTANIQLLPTERAGHAVELAYDYAKKYSGPLIVSASGDGGYNEVINGALRAQSEGATPICAVLPSGNANDHARTMQDRPLADLIVRGNVSDIDVLEVNLKHDGTTTRRYAHSYVGIGLTPTVAVELNKHTLNSFVEAWIVLKTFWGLKPVTLEVDGKKLHLDSLICSTIPEMAKVLSFADEAHPHDGLFELTIFEHNHKLKLIGRLIKGVVKHLGAEQRLARYGFTLLKPAPIQFDGEVLRLQGDTHITVEIRPGLLRTFVDA